ncbi:MAG: DUF1513 domain-containing protein [Pseudomonadales bacterium]|nr:DUF1513 domain-containing protein [Pseudomonadales bacterium]
MNSNAPTSFTTPHFLGESIPVTPSNDVNKGLLIGAGQHINPKDNVRRFDLSIIDLDAPNFAAYIIPTPFFGHGVSPNPMRPELIAVFEKRGKGACEVNLSTGQVTRTIIPHSNREFYGHGAYSPKGDLLYSTETIMEGNFDGVIGVRDAHSHEYLGDFPSFGAKPHDCHLIEGGKTLVVTNGGGPLGGINPSVTFIDVESETLIDKYEFENPNINAGHLSVTDNHDLAVVSAQREGLDDLALGGITLKLDDGSFQTLQEPSDIVNSLKGETLSVCFHKESGIVGTTTPAGNSLLFWNSKTGELVKKFSLQNPRGIALSLDRRFFIVSYGFTNPTEAICLISTDTLERVSGFDLNPTFITGSHLFTYHLPI